MTEIEVSWLKKVRMLKDVIIRPIREADVPGLRAVALESWRHTYRNIFDQQFIESFVNKNYAPAAIVSLFPRIQSGSMLFLVAECESELVGFCNMGLTQQRAELYRIYLLPACIGQGLGRRLLDLGVSFLRENNISKYFCFVHKNNEIGKHFYLNSSFKHIPENDKEDEWYMEKSIPRV